MLCISKENIMAILVCRVGVLGLIEIVHLKVDTLDYTRVSVSVSCLRYMD